MPATASRFADLEEVRRHHDPALVDRIVAGVFATDTAADDLAAAFAALPGGAGWRMLDTALDHGLDAVTDAPPALGAFLDGALEPPDWVDLDLVDRGAVAWWRAGPELQLLALTAGSLAYGYSTSFARPLLMTGRLEQMAPRRLGETSNWVVTAVRPGALHPGAAGLKATLHIRLVHALVRRHLAASGRWDTADWGAPLSVSDTLATGIIGFFLHPVSGLQDLGVRFSRDELDAMTHLWAWITFLQGVPADLLPRSYAEAQELGAATTACEDVHIEGADRLVHALLFSSWPYGATPLPDWIARRITPVFGLGLAGLARHWMGDALADELRIPETRLRHLIPVLRTAVRAREAARAVGLLPSDERRVALQLRMAPHTLRLQGARPAMGPEETARAPVHAA